MNYKVIDIENWDRKKLFKMYTTSLKVVMNLTAEVDVTKVVKFAKTNNKKFYPCMIYLISKAVNMREEFRYGLNEKGELVLWDYVSPSYTDFDKETEKFNKFVTEYTSDFETFYNRIESDRNKNKHLHGFIENQPINAFDMTCLPWISYKSFDMHVDCSVPMYFPIISFGKYEEHNKKFVLPLTINMHHALADGYHVSRFFEDVKDIINKEFN